MKATLPPSKLHLVVLLNAERPPCLKGPRCKAFFSGVEGDARQSGEYIREYVRVCVLSGLQKVPVIVQDYGSPAP